MVVQRKSVEPYLKDEVDFYQHQADGIRRMWNMQSFLLADDMGLGKTLQVLAVFSIHCKKMWSKYQVHQKMLVVCPVSLKDNWLDEVENFTRIKAVKLDGSPTLRNQQIKDFERISENESAILIVNYEQVRPHLADLNRLGFDCIAADEAHYLKNPKSQRTKSFQALRSTRNFLMTGTPLMNNVNELWVLLDRIQPGQWGSYWGFTQEFCAFGGYMGKQITGPKNEQKLRNDMANIMIRRTKEEVLDLPEVQYINRLVHLTPLQRKLYDKVAKEFLLDRGTGIDDEEAIENPMTKFLRLKQICGTTASVLDTKEDSSSKLDLAIEDAEEITAKGEKIVVFSQFRSVVSCYAQRARKAMPNVPVFELHGDVPINQRQDMVKEWGNTKGASIIVCIIKVAGVGLNMTQAKYGQFIDKDFTPGNNKQAVDRMHRIGADKTQAVQILEYRAKDTAETRVETILKVKKNIFEAVVEQKKLQDAIMDALKEDMARVRS